METLDVRHKLSALWLFVLLNIIFRDFHQFALKSHLEMVMSGYYNGVEITDELMLLGGILAEVPIAMVLLSLLLSRQVIRLLTVPAVLITGGTLLSSPPTDMDDVFFLVFELVALVEILRSAWLWREPDRRRA